MQLKASPKPVMCSLYEPLTMELARMLLPMQPGEMASEEEVDEAEQEEEEEKEEEEEEEEQGEAAPPA